MSTMYKNRRLIVFLIPPDKIVNGGILSIFSICKVSREFKNIHKSDVFLSTFPNNISYKKNDLFKNNEKIYSWDEIESRGIPESLILHIPEFASWDTFQSLKNSAFIRSIPDLQINIMNQNILLMQTPVEIAHWFTLTQNVTQTTAHNKYSNQELADEYRTPVHHLSTFVDEEQYEKIQFENKDNLILLSPDKHPMKNKIVTEIKKTLPSYKIITIENMKYEEYKKLMSRSRFSVTFGEGFDGYYVESFFSGGVTFAVFNNIFFPSKRFASFSNNFSSYESMHANISETIKAMQDKDSYNSVNQINLKEINALYNFQKYKINIKSFYEKKYTYNPSNAYENILIGKIIETKSEIIDNQNTVIADMERLIENKNIAVSKLDKIIDDYNKSRSWRITKPLRSISFFINKYK